MSGLPGQSLNAPEGFVDLTSGNPVTINVGTLVGDVPIPLSVLPFFRSEGGVRSYGGATTISVFEDGVSEGTSTAQVAAVTRQPIEGIGTFTLSSPNPQKIYRIRVRLRSAATDVNYKDFVGSFRVVSPLEVPLDFDTIPDALLPEIEYSGGNFAFAETPVNSTITLRSAGDGVTLPTNTSNFSVSATNWLASHLDKLRDGLFYVDFHQGGLYGAMARVTYAYYWTGSTYVISKFRRKDFAGWNQYSGTDLGVFQADVTFEPFAASLSIVAHPYGRGPQFETIVVIGDAGSMNLSASAIQLGKTIDITSVLLTDSKRLMRKSGSTDRCVTIVGVTDTQVFVREVPLFDRAVALHHYNDTNFTDITATAPTHLVNMRLVAWPFISFPNIDTFYDPALGGSQVYPRLEDLELLDESGVSQSTYADDEALWNALVTLRLPDAGLGIPVLDVRSFFSASDSWFKLTATVRTDASTTYDIVQYHPLNVDGEPLAWQRPDLDIVTQIPTFTFDEWGVLSMTAPATWTPSTDITCRGDIASSAFTAPASSSTVEFNLAGTVISRIADFVEVSWEDAGGNLVSFRVPTNVGNIQLTGSSDIQVWFDGNTLVFPEGGLTNVKGPTKVVTLQTTIGTLPLYDVQEGQVYRIGTFGKGSNLFTDPNVEFIDLAFTDTGDAANIVRVRNTFFDYRDQQRDNTTLAITNRGGPTSNGLADVNYRFSMPRLKYHSDTGEVEFEDDGRAVALATSHIVITNPINTVQASLTGNLLPGTLYSLGAAARQLADGCCLIVSARHSSGTVTTVGYRLIANAFVSASKLTPEGSW